MHRDSEGCKFVQLNESNVNKTMYKNHQNWKERETLLPRENRISGENLPVELYIDWNRWKIHLDHYPNPEARARIILLHGVGGNGRVLSFAAVPLHRAGYELIIPDLPGYGHSVVEKKEVIYADWVNLVSHLIERESLRDKRPLFIFGLSAGGMLAYHAAARNPKVNGIIATNLLDQRNLQVRDYSSGSKIISRVGVPLLKLSSRICGKMMLPMKAVANMKAIVNDKQMLKALLSDKTASGAKVPLQFIISLIEAQPDVEPEAFHLPVLLVHPEFDQWTPVWISRIFFDRIKSQKQLEILENAGHFPMEKPGIDQLPGFIQRFIDQNLDYEHKSN